MPLRLAIVFLVGAVLGTLGDGMHVAGGVLSYPHPAFLGEAWWVPLLMGSSLLAMVIGHANQKRSFAIQPRGSTVLAILSSTAFMGFYALTAILWRHPTLLTAILVGAFLLRPDARTAPALALALPMLIIGPAVELVLTRLHAFTYHATGLVFGVPCWLGGLYLHAALAARAIELRWPITDR